MASTTENDLANATAGFDRLFTNDLDGGKEFMSQSQSAFHLLGTGVITFLQAALSQEDALMAEASRCLTLAESMAKKEIKNSKAATQASRFPPGLEWEVLQADATILLGMTQALSESYVGYLQCMYSLNSAHGKFSKIFKIAFPKGASAANTPVSTPLGSLTPASSSTQDLAISTPTTPSALAPKGSFFGRWAGGSTSSLASTKSAPPALKVPLQDGPVENFIVAGAAFGYGLFNLVFSLLPEKVRKVVGFFGFSANRAQALETLLVASAVKSDIHAVFASDSPLIVMQLSLMSHHGFLLLFLPWIADEQKLVDEYQTLLDNTASKYPDGSLWILNKAKILRFTRKPEESITVLQAGLEKGGTFLQADALLVYELAWLLLSQRRYEESAQMFLRMSEMNKWSHATYWFLALGCYLAVGDLDRAQQTLDELPGKLEQKKPGGREIPTEVFIKRKIAFWKAKQARHPDASKRLINYIKLNPAEEFSIFWNAHARISSETAQIHIIELLALTPPIKNIKSPYAFSSPSSLPSATVSQAPSPASSSFSPSPDIDLDTPDEHALRALLLGILHRTTNAYEPSRLYLTESLKRQNELGDGAKWIASMAMFELAVLELLEFEEKEQRQKQGVFGSEKEENGEAGEKQNKKHQTKGSKSEGMGEETKAWKGVLSDASAKLDQTMGLLMDSDMSGRLESRIGMLRDEIAKKRANLGLAK